MVAKKVQINALWALTVPPSLISQNHHTALKSRSSTENPKSITYLYQKWRYLSDYIYSML